MGFVSTLCPLLRLGGMDHQGLCCVLPPLTRYQIGPALSLLRIPGRLNVSNFNFGGSQLWPMSKTETVSTY